MLMLVLLTPFTDNGFYLLSIVFDSGCDLHAVKCLYFECEVSESSPMCMPRPHFPAPTKAPSLLPADYSHSPHHRPAWPAPELCVDGNILDSLTQTEQSCGAFRGSRFISVGLISSWSRAGQGCARSPCGPTAGPLGEADGRCCPWARSGSTAQRAPESRCWRFLGLILNLPTSF